MAPPLAAFALFPKAMEEPPQALALEPKAWSLSLPTSTLFSSKPARALFPNAKPFVDCVRASLPMATPLLAIVRALRPIATACAPWPTVPVPRAIVLISLVVASCPIAIPPLLSVIPGVAVAGFTVTFAPFPMAIPFWLDTESGSPLPTDASLPIATLCDDNAFDRIP